MPYKTLEITNAAAVYQQAPKISQFYKGFSSTDISNVNSKLYDLDIIRQDLINQFKTRKGERLMNPTFGTIIWDILMEPMTDDIYDLLSQDITKICNSDPRITPTQLNINEFDGGYLIEISVQLVGTNQSISLVRFISSSRGWRLFK
jgi:phage baseplate assembly protein W